MIAMVTEKDERAERVARLITSDGMQLVPESDLLRCVSDTGFESQWIEAAEVAANIFGIGADSDEMAASKLMRNKLFLRKLGV